MIERVTNLRAAHLALFTATLFQIACDHPSSGDGAPSTSASPVATSIPSGKTSANVTSSASATAAPLASSNDDPFGATSGAVLRDDEDVTIDGTLETWRLEWAHPAIPDCIGEWESCACAGFAFGEKGDLDLVRARAGKDVERMRLDPLFDGNDARVARWPVTIADRGKKPAIGDIAMRPVKDVIKFGDYDHDGRATEFLLQVAAGPCGHSSIIAIGISKSNPKIHALSSIEKPDEPLSLDRLEDWEKLKNKSPVDLVQIACGDHGATESTTQHITADGNFHVKVETKKCQ